MTPDLEAPTAPAPLQRQPIVILTVLLVLGQALITGLGIGELKDGFQVGDISVFVLTVLTGVIARMSVFSQETVDLLAPRSAQKQAVAKKNLR